jgi:flagellar basal-body rod protein FlgF
MSSNVYVGLSAQISLQRRLETIANNVANASTAGFRAEEVKFESVLSRVNPDPVSYASAGKPYLSRKSGEIVRTDNLFDVAVQGDAWLAIQTPGGTVYTR